MTVSLNYVCGRQGTSIPLKIWNFPAGEFGVQIPDFPSLPKGEEDFKLTLKWDYTGDHEMMVVAQVVDAIRRSAVKRAELVLDLCYLPYARQDRVCNDGESHALKVFSTWLNSLKFDTVVITDPHSYVAEALIDNMVSIPQEAGFEKYLRSVKTGYDVLIAPDAGAAKKVEKCRHAHVGVYGSAPEIRVAHKVRKEGRVEVSLDVSGLTDKRVCVIDDICDGGATFISLAECFNGPHPVEPETLDLYVSHGIFSNDSNIKVMAGQYSGIKGYDKIITPNLMNKKASGYVTTI